MRLRPFFCHIMFFILLSCASAAFAKDALRLGVLAEEDAEKTSTYALHKPVVDALNAQYPTMDIQLEVLDLQELNARAEEGSIDIIMSNPIHYVLLSQKYPNLKLLATRIKSINGISTPLVGGVIFTRSHRHDINSLEDIVKCKDCTIAVRGRCFWGCFAIPAHELLHAGVTTQRLKSVLEMGTVDALVQAVMEGKADVGMLRTDILETMFAQGKLKPEEVKVLNEQKNAGFPFISSTPLYPEWPVFAMPHVNKDICKSFAEALFALKLPEPSSTDDITIAGYTLPLSYESVKTVLSDLEYPGFSPMELFWNDLLYRSKWQAYMILGGLVLIGALFLLLGLALLQASDEKRRMRAMLSGMPYPALLVNSSHRIVAINHAAKELFNAKEGEYCWEQLWHGEFLPEEQRALYERGCITSNMACRFCLAQQALNTAQSVHLELAINGRWWDSWWVPIDSSTFLHYFIDITEHKEREKRLEETQRFLREIADTVQDMIWVKDINKRYLFANKAICEKLLCAKDTNEPLGKTDLFFAERIRAEHPENKTWHTFGEICQDSDAIVISTGKAGRFEEDGNVRGKYLCLDVIKVPLFDENGKIIAVVGSARDITRDKELQKEKEMLERRLQESSKMEAIGIMAGGIAHNFNNLLQVITGYVQLLSHRLSHKDDAIERALTQITTACERGAMLVRNLMAFSHKTDISSAINININNEVLRIKYILESTFPKNIELKIEMTDGLWTVNANPVQIQIILMNMANNSRDAMPNGGILGIRTSNVHIAKDDLNTTNKPWTPGDYVLLEISDTGCGMSEETVKHIFEPFFTTKEVGKGTGLGLSTTYGIVKSYGGYIFCKTELGKGTIFEIYLPAVSRESLPIETDIATVDVPPPTQPQGSGCGIMVVDDEEAIRSLIKQVLETAGYRVFEAENGDKALGLYEKEGGNIDLILLDLNMPGIDGHVCLKRLLEINEKARILVASGYSDKGMEQKVLSEGAMAFMEKPFKIEGLITKINEILSDIKHV